MSENKNIFTVENDYLKVEIDKIGGSLNSVILKETGTEYLWQGDPKYWEEKAPNLFPFIGRLNGSRFTHGEKSYEMKLHGFLRNQELEPVKSDKDEIILNFDGEKWVHENKYPFDYNLNLSFKLNKNEIICTYEIENKSAETMYFAVGGHPGINLPLESGLKFEDYRIEFPSECKPKRVIFSSVGLTTEERPSFILDENNGFDLEHSLFDNDAIVLTDTPHEVMLKSEKGKRFVTLRYDDMPYIGFWHADRTNAPYVCLEPWTSLPGRDGVEEEISRMNDRIEINSGESKKISWSLEVN